MQLAEERADSTCMLHSHIGERDGVAIDPRIGDPPGPVELS